MADEEIKERVATALRHTLFNQPEDYVAVTDGDGDLLHVLVISPRVRGKRASEKRDLIWGELINRLTQPEWSRVSLLVAKTPDEVMAE